MSQVLIDGLKLDIHTDIHLPKLIILVSFYIFKNAFLFV